MTTPTTCAGSWSTAIPGPKTHRSTGLQRRRPGEAAPRQRDGLRPPDAAPSTSTALAASSFSPATEWSSQISPGRTQCSSARARPSTSCSRSRTPAVGWRTAHPRGRASAGSGVMFSFDVAPAERARAGFEPGTPCRGPARGKHLEWAPPRPTPRFVHILRSMAGEQAAVARGARDGERAGMRLHLRPLSERVLAHLPGRRAFWIVVWASCRGSTRAPTCCSTLVSEAPSRNKAVW